MAFRYFFQVFALWPRGLGGTSQMIKLATIWAAFRQASIMHDWRAADRCCLDHTFIFSFKRAQQRRTRGDPEFDEPAGALASHLSNSLGEIDRSLTVIAALYAQKPENFDVLVRSKPKGRCRTQYRG